MSLEKADAIVIRQADFSETSRVVTFFTREFGRIAAVAKGARRLKGPFDSALDLLAACRIVFIRKSSGSLDLLTEAQLISRFQPNGKDLVSLYGGYYVAELLASLTEEYDPHSILFDEAVATLRRLAEGSDPRLAVLRFELVTLREIGQLPSFEACVVCGTPAESGASFAYWVSQGGLICRNCRKEEYEHRQSISPATAALWRRLSDETAPDFSRLAISPVQLRQMRQAVTSAVCHVLGRRPKLLRYLQS